MPEALIDVSGLWGAVEGYVISALEAPRASISTFARHFSFDAVESEGRIKFLMRGRIASATVIPESMVAHASAQGDVMELTRAQETEFGRDRRLSQRRDGWLCPADHLWHPGRDGRAGDRFLYRSCRAL